TIGLLTDAGGFPLMVEAFEGNKAETRTMLPVIEAFMTAHDLAEVTIVADAGMISEANKRAIEQAGLSFILGVRISDVPYVVKQWRRDHPDTDIPDGHVFTQHWPAGPADARRDQVIYYQYRADRARRSLRGSTSRSPRPKPPSPAEHRSSATGSSNCRGPTRASTGHLRPRPGHWPGSRAMSPTSTAPAQSS